MQVKPSFNHRGETCLEFVETIVAQEASVRPSLILHGHLRTLTGDRLAVATVLLLGQTITGSLRVGRPISKRVAIEIRRFLGDDGLDLPEVTDVPLAVHSGTVEMVIGTEGLNSLTDPSQTDRRRLLFQELPSHSSVGRLFTFDKLIVSSNSWLYSMPSSHRPDRILETSLAVPLLMAQDLGASKIEIGQELVSSRKPLDVSRVASLLASTDILLTKDGEAIHAA